MMALMALEEEEKSELAHQPCLTIRCLSCQVKMQQDGPRMSIDTRIPTSHYCEPNNLLFFINFSVTDILLQQQKTNSEAHTQMSSCTYFWLNLKETGTWKTLSLQIFQMCPLLISTKKNHKSFPGIEHEDTSLYTVPVSYVQIIIFVCDVGN